MKGIYVRIGDAHPAQMVWVEFNDTNRFIETVYGLDVLISVLINNKLKNRKVKHAH
jgi:hypothetical protein